MTTSEHPEPYVNHVALTLDGAHAGPLMSMMRWKPEAIGGEFNGER